MTDPGTESVAFELAMEGMRRGDPGQFYEPHHTEFRGPRAGLPSGQRQFHESPHPVRIVASGNGWGGTVAMGHEINAWATGSNRWQVTPKPPIVAVWFCTEFRQFAIILKELRAKCFGPSPTFKEAGFGGPQLVWPNGSTMYLASYDRSWEHVQGLNHLDLAAFDEQPPRALWVEIEQRRRADHKTRLISKATQTSGDSWMETIVYDEWVECHRRLGIDDEERMLIEQRHPYLFVWSKGGIHSNPACDAQDVAEYEARVWPSEKVRTVRLYGGFMNMVGSPVFDLDDLDWLKARRAALFDIMGGGTRGTLSLNPDPEPVAVAGLSPARYHV